MQKHLSSSEYLEESTSDKVQRWNHLLIYSLKSTTEKMFNFFIFSGPAGYIEISMP